MQIEKVEQVYQEETVDLLNLNSLNIESESTPKKSPSTNFDLLSGLADEPSEPFTDFIGSSSTNTTTTTSANNGQNIKSDIFDPFGTASENTQNNLFGGWNNTNNNVNSQKPNDIFGGLGKKYIYINILYLSHILLKAI